MSQSNPEVDPFEEYYKPIGRLIVGQAKFHASLVRRARGLGLTATEKAAAKLRAEDLRKLYADFFANQALPERDRQAAADALQTFDDAQQMRNVLGHGAIWENTLVDAAPQFAHLPRISFRYVSQKAKDPFAEFSNWSPTEISGMADRVRVAHMAMTEAYHAWRHNRSAT
ncbi:hypothetical protein E9232_001134 [Inquilinus ginsengisoli]|uniref:Uncharacterized protein n=1 Tax=Inquilinus ginsengisoli TaxID=363840 RepID=A0ABU1JJX7_9PROT|nr:hypothetical protein [Inquilinus ginsengisoli]MDR6288627.1 hypothetical protein [Inquilinus ginsengisoli]